MEQTVIGIKLFITCMSVMFGTIIGVYVWTFKIGQGTTKELGRIYHVVNKHIQNPDIHTDKKELVNGEVCRVVHENLAMTVEEIKSDVKTLLRKG